MITVATTFFRGRNVNPKSLCFTEEWVDKLYRGIKRNLKDFDFVCFTDQDYEFEEDVIQVNMTHNLGAYMPILEIFRVDLGRVLFMGLDTVITGSLEDLATYKGPFAMIRDPNHNEKGASGVMSFPFTPKIWENFLKNGSGRYDQDFLHTQPHKYLCDEFPGQMVSYKCHVKKDRSVLEDARIVYFHGSEKPHEINEDFVKEHWT